MVDEESQEALNDLMSELALLRDSLQPALAASRGKDETCPLKKGEIYAARYSLDGDLYRVRIVSVGNDDHEPIEANSLVEVEYIDYGNTEEVEASDIYQLPTGSLTEVPPLARPVNIRGAQFAFDSEEGRERLKRHLTEGSVHVGGARGEESQVLVDGKPVNLQYLLKCKVT